MAAETNDTRPTATARPGGDGSERRVTAWIGQGVTVEGRVTSTQDLRIDGRIHGTIEVGQHEVTLGAGADVKANLTAKAVLIGGSIVGNVVAKDRVEIQATGSVLGDVSAPRLVVRDGGVLQGKIDAAGTRRPPA